MRGTPRGGRNDAGGNEGPSTGSWRRGVRTWGRLAALVAVAWLGGCFGDPVSSRPPDRMTITVPVADSRLPVGEIAILEASLSARGVPVPRKEVTWWSSDPTILTVAPGGIITAGRRGIAEITASVQGRPTISASVVITVVGASALALDTRTVTLEEGGQRRLRASVKYDPGTIPPVIWRSSATAVALVDNQGLVTALGPGTAIIRATASGLTDSAVVTVTPQPVGSIAIDQGTSTMLFVGDRRPLSATVRNNGGVVVTGRTISWTTADPTIATVSASGLVTAIGAGTTTVSAESGGKVAETVITVRDPAASLVVAPASVRVARGRTQKLTIEVRNSAGALLTEKRPAAWSSAAPTVATVSADGVVTGLANGTATMTATVEGVTGTATVTVVDPVSTVLVTPGTATLVVGGAQPMVASARDAKGAALTGRPVVWSSSDPSVATVSATGRVTAEAAGSATITATVDGEEGSATVTVVPVVGTVLINPARSNLLLGRALQLSASVRDEAGTVLTGRAVTWSSSDPVVATVNASGVVTAVAIGNVTIAASVDGVVGSATVRVVPLPPALTGVTVSPDAVSLVAGGARALTATATQPSGAPAASVTFGTTLPSVATVSPTGVITAVAAGTTTITVTATAAGNASFSAATHTTMVEVAVAPLPPAAVLVTPASPSLIIGRSQPMMASARDAKGGALTGRAVVWSTSNASVATISATGLVTAVAPGTVTIAATVEGVEGTATLTVVPPVATVQVTPTSTSLFVGRTLQMSALARDADGALLTGRSVTWLSSDPTVATISATGMVTAHTAGSATITATSEGVQGSAALTLVPLPAAITGVSVSFDTVTLVTGRTRAITAAVTQPTGAPAATVSYGSVLPSVATVSPTGVITAVGAGTAIITVTATSTGNVNYSAATQTALVEVTVLPAPVASVQVTPGTTNLVIGATQQLTTTVRDSVGAPLTGRVATWASSNPAVATVNTTGLITAVAVGTATLTVTVEGTIATALVSVAPLPSAITSLTVSPNTYSLVVGQTRAVAPVVTKPTGAPNATLTYGTTVPAVATVSSTGVITAVAPGTATITVTATAPGNTSFSAATISETIAVTVAAAVASVQVTPGTATLMAGTTQQLATTVRDSTGAELTGRAVVWTTSSAAVASVNATGLVTAVAVGTATITATVGGVPGTMTVTVSPLAAAITDVAVSPTAVSLQVGRTSTLTPTVTQPAGAATATISYGTTTPSVATVSAAGLVLAVGPGTATITMSATAAANTGFSAATRTATVTVTVTAVPVATVQVAPATASILAGSTQQFVVTARDADGQILTGRPITWATLNAAAATVSASGLVTGVAAGSATITATVEGATGSATITVEPAPAAITSLTVSPTTATLTVAQTRALSPTVTQPTGAPAATVTYRSSDPDVATVSPSGVVTAVAAGTATITVTATVVGNGTFASTTVSATVEIVVQ